MNNDRTTDAEILKILKEIQESQKQALEILKEIKAGYARTLKKPDSSDDPLIIYESECLPKI